MYVCMHACNMYVCMYACMYACMHYSALRLESLRSVVVCVFEGFEGLYGIKLFLLLQGLEAWL